MKRIALFFGFVVLGLALAQGQQATWPTTLATILAGIGALVAAISKFTWDDWIGLFKTSTFWGAISALAAAYAGLQSGVVNAPEFVAALYATLVTIFVRKGMIAHARIAAAQIRQQIAAMSPTPVSTPKP